MQKQHFLAVSFFILTAFFSVTNAQTGITIGPPRVYYTIGPGQSQSEKVLLSNPSKDYTLELGVSLSDWEYNEFGDNQVYDAGTLASSCANWVTVSESFFSLAPGESKEIDVMMSVPQGHVNDTVPVHTAMLYVTQLNPRDGVDQDGANIRIAVRTGIKLYQRRLGANMPMLEITDFKLVDSEGGKSVSLYFENQGNIWADGRIAFELFNQETGQTTPLVNASLYTMPGDKRQFPVMLPEELAKGTYIVTAMLDYGENQAIKMAELEFKHD